ncbi:hypothetical protein [Mycobacterium sp. E740]|uniref:hypothetical protein n=1 Tax=Mycobacterium sp. E740 TaxID=1834149 RepID=UPI00080032F2|nr:hypothetical protein [Mycobacterium sp. E740]OBI72813.1 hypothetical protein A5663_07670 [Mycobacterium sp. E740]
MTTIPPPNIPLPAGATPADDEVRSWADYENEFRIVYGEKRVLCPEAAPETDQTIWVEPCAVQMADGTIQPRDPSKPPLHSGPSVSVQAHWENYLTAAEARQLARYIDAAAATDELWSDADMHTCQFD